MELVLCMFKKTGYLQYATNGLLVENNEMHIRGYDLMDSGHFPLRSRGVGSKKYDRWLSLSLK